jgi:hypothetical protein
MSISQKNLYEVMSPWAEVDPIPLKGITPRIKGLAGKKIGLFRNSKRAARPILSTIEARLKERFPDSEIKGYSFMPNGGIAENEEWISKFDEWLKGIDALILAYGD